jgi:coproporphyrinogen III oxidase-like Fe-S oxidoreductase
MLSLRSSGLDLTELGNMYGCNWYELNKTFIAKLIDDRFVIKIGSRIRFTSKGYAVGDEILTKFVM